MTYHGIVSRNKMETKHIPHIITERTIKKYNKKRELIIILLFISYLETQKPLPDN